MFTLKPETALVLIFLLISVFVLLLCTGVYIGTTFIYHQQTAQQAMLKPLVDAVLNPQESQEQLERNKLDGNRTFHGQVLQRLAEEPAPVATDGNKRVSV